MVIFSFQSAPFWTFASDPLAKIWGFPKIRGYHFGGPHNKDYNILGSILGSPNVGKLPFGLHGISLSGFRCLAYCRRSVRWTPHPVLVTTRDISNYFRVLLYSYYTPITGWGVHPSLLFPPYSCESSYASANRAPLDILAPRHLMMTGKPGIVTGSNDLHTGKTSLN